MMRAVLHDFSDEDVTTMLHNLRASFGSHRASLVIVEVAGGFMAHLKVKFQQFNPTDGPWTSLHFYAGLLKTNN